MPYTIERTKLFDQWYNGLSEADQVVVVAMVGLLEKLGTTLPFPYSSGINGSKHKHMRELRKKYKNKLFRILYAFDPGRVGILLVGGNKTGDKRWYEKNVPVADKLYDEHLVDLKKKKEKRI